ncbi:MAG: PspC domain-containing protein [Sphingomonas sp.]|nr:PspC domain-containing protein [Sphingomonas sp.]
MPAPLAIQAELAANPTASPTATDLPPPAAAAAQTPQPVAERQLALPLRNDTILGVCQGIGEEFGVHANWLRVPIAGLVMFNWMAALGIYLALGLALLASRLVYPRRAAIAPPRTLPKETVAVSADNSDQPLSAAA